MSRTLVVPVALLCAGLGLSACEQATDSTDTSTSAGVTAVPPGRGLDVAEVTRGQAVYERYCLECHGVRGQGQPGDWRIRDAEGFFPPPPLDDSAHAWHHPTAALLETIREGSPPGQGRMPAWKDKLSEQEMADVVSYIKSLWSDPVYALWQKMERQSMEP